MDKYEQAINRQLSLLHAERHSEQDEKNLLEEEKDHLDGAKEAREILQTIAWTVQHQAHQRIAQVVSQCLESVFDEPYEFKIEFEMKRGRTEANLIFTRDGHNVSPLDAAGGGVVDVASFALRLACLSLRKPKLRKILILDEPFKFVSRDFLPRVREMLILLAESTEYQFVMVTHIEQLRCGKVVNL